MCDYVISGRTPLGWGGGPDLKRLSDFGGFLKRLSEIKGKTYKVICKM